MSDWTKTEKTHPPAPEFMYDKYLVQTRYDQYGIADYFGNGCWDGWDEVGDKIDEIDIVAWQKLPEKCKGVPVE